MKIKLPMKFRILQLICEKSIEFKIINTSDVISLITSEYGNEKQCSYKNITKHILALKSVGLIKETKIHKFNNKLISEYRSTREGLNRMKLIPNSAESYKEWAPFKRKAITIINRAN